jgi:hypothetical protein
LLKNLMPENQIDETRANKRQDGNQPHASQKQPAIT